MADTTLERLKRALDAEVRTDALTPLPGDFYSGISVYCQKLRRSSGSSASEVTNRLVSRQATMIDSMVRQLLALRTKKASSKRALVQLLPEERYVCSAQRRHQRRFEAFVEAVSAGQPSFIDYAHTSEDRRNVSVKFTSHVGELVGLDSRRYGPFDPEDVASLPAVNADVLIASGDAVEIYSREDA